MQRYESKPTEDGLLYKILMMYREIVRGLALDPASFDYREVNVALQSLHDILNSQHVDINQPTQPTDDHTPPSTISPAILIAAGIAAGFLVLQ